MNLDNEISYSFSRSGGKGGQNVNRVATQVHLYFHIAKSTILHDEQKEILLKKWANKISNEGLLVLKDQSSRSQLQNKENVRKKFYQLLQKAFLKPKTRIATKQSKASKEKRILGKKLLSLKKENRKKIRD